MPFSFVHSAFAAITASATNAGAWLGEDLPWRLVAVFAAVAEGLATLALPVGGFSGSSCPFKF